jgi:hypothetical protein
MGQTRTRLKFLWLPRTMENGERAWLEWITVHEVWATTEWKIARDMAREHPDAPPWSGGVMFDKAEWHEEAVRLAQH